MKPERSYKIAVVVPRYGLAGGTEQYAAELTERLARNEDYEIHVLANHWRATSERITFHKVPIISFPKYLTTPSFAYLAGRKIERMGFDLVHAHDRIFSADVFTMHGIPHLSWVREIRRKRPSLFDLATAQVEKRLVLSSRCNIFISVSHLAQEKFTEVYPVAAEKLRIVPPGVDVAEFERKDRTLCRRETRNRFHIGADDLLILFVAMNFEVKGLDVLIQALGSFKRRQGGSPRLLVVGKGNSGPYKALAMKEGVGDNVVFAGILGREILIETYLAGDLYVMLSKFDTFGMVVLEAMTASLPVVVSDKVGAQDIVTAGVNGFIVAPDDTAGLAAVLEKLADGGRREGMGKEALKTARGNGWDAVADKMDRIYRELLQKKGL
ncbi:MAG: glycosyltransferase family 4 protein [Smithellaceae bacterium]|nr:glycosyltransferase family 4 protein [Smithellaceae bacterium]